MLNLRYVYTDVNTSSNSTPCQSYFCQDVTNLAHFSFRQIWCQMSFERNRRCEVRLFTVIVLMHLSYLI